MAWKIPWLGLKLEFLRKTEFHCPLLENLWDLPPSHKTDLKSNIEVKLHCRNRNKDAGGFASLLLGMRITAHVLNGMIDFVHNSKRPFSMKRPTVCSHQLAYLIKYTFIPLLKLLINGMVTFVHVHLLGFSISLIFGTIS